MKYIFSLILITLILPAFVLAQTPPANPVGQYSATGPSQYTVDTVVKIIVNLVNWMSWGISVVAVVMGLYAGFLFVSGGDDTKKITEARSIIIYAVIGVAVAVLSFSIVTITKSIFGI